jgi:hypothetical protein
MIVPLADLNPGGGPFDQVSIAEGTGSGNPLYIDYVQFVPNQLLDPTPEAPPNPDPTPFPTQSSQASSDGHVVYDDAISEGWSLDPWGGTADLSNTDSVYDGSFAIHVTLEPEGAITFDTGSPPSISDSTYLVFYLNGGGLADQQLFVEMRASDGTSLGRVNLMDYIEDSPLRPDQWHQVAVPVSTLNPAGALFAWFDIGDSSGEGAAAFYIDEILFVTVDR